MNIVLANVKRAISGVYHAVRQAKLLAKNDEKNRAISMLSRAEVDAELAIALSRADAEKAEAQGAMDRVRQLRMENK